MSEVRQVVLVWAALLGLLALTVLSSFELVGLPSLAASMGIALLKAGLVFWFFMHLRESSGLVRILATGAGAWLLILLLLSAADYVTRAIL
jgi:cytochrome c oxidase subunit 4